MANYTFATAAQKAELQKLIDAIAAKEAEISARDAIKIKYQNDLGQIVASSYTLLVNNESRWQDPHPDEEAVLKYISDGGKITSPYTTNPAIAAWQVLKAQNSIYSTNDLTPQDSTYYQGLKRGSAPSMRMDVEKIGGSITEAKISELKALNEERRTLETFLNNQDEDKADAAVTQAIKKNIASITSDPVKLAVAIIIIIIVIALLILLFKKLSKK